MLMQFDIVEIGGTFALVMGHDDLPKGKTIVVAPLIEGLSDAGRLTPTIRHEGTDYILYVMGLITVRASDAKATGHNAMDRRDAIIGAMDMFLTGV